MLFRNKGIPNHVSLTAPSRDKCFVTTDSYEKAEEELFFQPQMFITLHPEIWHLLSRYSFRFNLRSRSNFDCLENPKTLKPKKREKNPCYKMYLSLFNFSSLFTRNDGFGKKVKQTATVCFRLSLWPVVFIYNRFENRILVRHLSLFIIGLKQFQISYCVKKIRIGG